jgi:xanthine dehydrogenase accessory factor
MEREGEGVKLPAAAAHPLTPSPHHPFILIRGAGDLATGAAWRLARCGLPVIMTELAQPLVVRRTVSFAEAVYAGRVTVEGLTAEHVATIEQAAALARTGVVAVLVDPDGAALPVLHPPAVVDARMAKRVLDTRISDAPLVVALGPGFTAGVDCHAVVETNRGHDLGRVYWRGSAEPDTGTPGGIAGHGADRVLRAPRAGVLVAVHAIGDALAPGEMVARVDGEAVLAPFAGMLRGLLHAGLTVQAGQKIGDVDPRARREHCFTISDKALAVAGGVLEAILAWENAANSRTS